MSKAASSPILQQLLRLVEDPAARGSSDAALLQRLGRPGREAAFEALLRRHGPMVLDVCRCVLVNEADAEDAFQATFLILARKAASIRKAGSLASWLHGVAYRTALKARAESARRHRREARLPRRDEAAATDLSWREAQRVLHEELNRLAESHRAPLVLCYLQGMTQDEAAAALGLAKGTLKGRLERGRALLRERLLRRGLGRAGVLLASAWPAAMESGARRAAVAGSTGKAAALFAVGGESR